MSFATDGSSREAIQAIQFELWPDCNTGCKFCYLNGTRRVTTELEKYNNLVDALETLSNKNIMYQYNAVGLIGGEFFQGQLSSDRLLSNWYTLLAKLNGLLVEEKTIKEVWIASSLIEIKQPQLIDTLNNFNYDLFEEDQRVTLCTSYDTIGRFSYNLTDKVLAASDPKDIQVFLKECGCETIEELKNVYIEDDLRIEHWLDNIKYIAEHYNRVTIHVQIILTQDVIDKLIENPNYFDFLTDLGCIIDFRYPSITRADCPTATIIQDYRSLLLQKYSQFPRKFFIEDRPTFLRFLKVFAEKYGLEKVRNLIHQPEMRSRRLKIYVDNAEIEDRWNDDRNVYLSCGHLIDGLCYINDDTHCIYCDIEKFLNSIEGE